MATLVAILGGCGSERPPPAGDMAVTPISGGAVGGFGDAGTTKLPGCGQQDDGSACDCVDIPLFAEPPNMYFVLDHSGSMTQDGKWEQVRAVVAQIVRGLGPRASFGATVFPGFDVRAACAPPEQVLALRPGDPPGQDGPTITALLTKTQPPPNGGTPTAEALRVTLNYLRSVPGKTFVILATDGGPNCNELASCGFDQCMPNIEDEPQCPREGPRNCCSPPEGFRESCLDSGPTASAVAALKAAQIPVYVIGLPGTARYGMLLDQLAVSGGTALAGSPKYYRVEASTENAILSALKKVAAKIVATCDFTLESAPQHPDLVNVYLDEVVLPQDPVNGWKIEGANVTLLGAACDKVLAGDVLGVRIIAGCPTVSPR